MPARDIFSEMDADGDGEVTEAEFDAHRGKMQGMQGRKGGGKW